jgi:oligopeptide transport system substrate-binding protein
MAMNKQEIVNGVPRCNEDVARSFVPPVIRNYMPYESALCGQYDPEEARRLLAEAGYPGGRGLPKLPLLYNSDEGHKMVAELVQRQWKENLGIDVEPQNQEWGAYLYAVENMDYSVARSAWTGDYLDPNTFLGMFLTGSEDNQTGWSNAKYDELVHAAEQEPDAKKRLQELHDAEAILMDEQPIIPIYFQKTKNLVRPYVHDFYDNVFDVHSLKYIRVDEAARQKFLKAQGLR